MMKVNYNGDGNLIVRARSISGFAELLTEAIRQKMPTERIRQIVDRQLADQNYTLGESCNFTINYTVNVRTED